MNYKVGKYNPEVIIVKKHNRNTYIRVKEDLNIYVTTNMLASKNYIIDLLDKNYNFLLKNLERQEKLNEKNREFYFLGQKYDVIYTDRKLEIYEDKIFVKDDKALERFIKKQTKQIFQERLDYNYNLFTENIPYPTLRLRKMKTRWGVCNKKTRVVTLNTELIKYDISLLDYVIVHELSHFIYFNHSRDFWNQVGKYYPNYKKARNELKD